MLRRLRRERGNEMMSKSSPLPNLFDSIKVQYQLVLDFFHLEDIGMVLVRGVKEKGDIVENAALKEVYDLGMSVE